jgi:membrane-associated protease RseP (regulator of RpoE activity)
VWAKSLGGNALAEARVGLAGPILGTIGAAACLPIAAATGSDLWTALAFTGFFLNLFNLLPILPLDGGHVFWSLVEKVRGRRVALRTMEQASVVGFMLILIVFAIGLTNDIDRFSNGGFDIR